MRWRLWGLWLAVGLASPVDAQAPQGNSFTYQGRLSDDGAPASGAFDFRFALYDAAVGGSQVGPIATRDDVAVTNGLFTIALDFGAVFDGNRRFLDVAVRPGASTGAFVSLTPRQELTPAPATLFSAATPWGGVSGKPAGFADNIDDDSGGTVTSVTAGPGLLGGPITSTGSLAVAFAGTGAAATAARSDHDHDAAYVRNSTAPQPGVNFNVEGTGTAGVLAATTQFNLGGARILANPGTNNLFAGVGAGASQTTGVANTYFGASAGAANATGGSNSFFGFNAGRNTTGGSNSFFGDAAGFSNTTGGSAFFGFLAGFNNTTGGGNAFFGRQAGRNNTTGNGHSFFGDGAGFSNTTSINNSFFGRNAGGSNTLGSVNSFFGEGAGANNTTGGSNVFVGREAAFQNVTGSRNVVIGSATGFGNSSGSDLTVVGTFANVGADGLSFATALGAGAIVAASNTVVLGRPVDTVRAPGAMSVGGALSAGAVNATGLVSANIVEATAQFDLAGSRMLASLGNQNLFVGPSTGPALTTGSFNTFVGSGAGFSTTEGNGNTFVGQGAGLVNTTGSNNTFLGKSSGASAPVSNSVAIGAGVQVATGNTVLLGTSAHTTIVPGLLRAGDAGGNFSMQVVTSAIGGGVVGRNLYIQQLNQTGSPAHLCFKVAPDGVQALLITTCTTPFAAVRHQTDLQAFAGGLGIVGRLQPVSFTRKDDGTRDVGLTAEDVASVEPLLVRWNDEGGAEEVKAEQLIAVLVGAIKEQQEQLEAQREQMGRQQRQVDALARVVCGPRPDNSPCREAGH